MRKLTILLIFLGLSGCQSELQAADSQLQSWTLEMANSQIPVASMIAYQYDEYLLVFLGVDHSNRIDSPTFELINEAFNAFQFEVVIIEGFETSAPEARINSWAITQKSYSGTQSGGEAVPAILGAIQQSAITIGGEPSDVQIRDLAVGSGVSKKDLLGFYTLRSIPQWVREDHITSVNDLATRKLIVEELARNRDRLKLNKSLLTNYADWHEWYVATNGKTLGSQFNPQEAGPAIDGKFGSNLIGATVSRIRAKHLHKLMIDQLNRSKNTLVVYGNSHLPIHRPALDHILTAPCYEGTDPNAAAAACNILTNSTTSKH